MTDRAVLRTPDERLADLPDFLYEPRHVEVDGMRMAYVEDGPADGPVVLCLHGEPTWSYLYRHMLPVLGGAGLRAVAPANQAAWGVLDQWTKPALTLWAPNDPVLGNQQPEFRDRIPGAAGLDHQTFEDASHFLQEDLGPELARATIDLIAATP